MKTDELKQIITDFIDIYDQQLLQNRGDNIIINNLVKRITDKFADKFREDINIDYSREDGK